MNDRRTYKTSDAVSATNLCKSFSGDAVISNVTFTVPEGTIVGFIGPSGSGKTTLVRLMTGIHAPTSGDILFHGRTPTKLSRAERQEIGYLPQLPVLFHELTVWHNLSFHASLYGVRLRRRRRLHELLDFVELGDDRNKHVSDISGGMQRRLALAGALVHDPKYLFLDEPTAGIDPILRQKFWDHFRTLRDDGRTLVVTTQYVGEAANCDYVAVLSEGELVLIDTPEGLRRYAFDSESVEVTTVSPQPDALFAELTAIPGVRELPERINPVSVRLAVDNAAEIIPTLAMWFEQRGVTLVGCREELPDYDDVFVRIIERHRASLVGAS
ncbi:MAG: ABC transporter ATP-binding protein [Acidimicrobiales bacterium]